MGKLKELREKRASAFDQIDELRKTTDGREMTAEEQEKWDALIADFDKLDNRVKQEERFQEMEAALLKDTYEGRNSGAHHYASPNGQDGGTQHPDPEYRSAFIDYLIKGEGVLTNQSRSLFEKRAGIQGVSGGVLVPKLLGDQIEVALKTLGGMFQAGSVFYTSKGGDLTMPTVNDTSRVAMVITEYGKSSQAAPVFGSKVIKAFTYRTPIVPLSVELLQDSYFDLDAMLAELLATSFWRGINAHLTTGDGNGKPLGIVPSATASDATPATIAIKTDDLIDLMASVNGDYAEVGKFMFNHRTFWSLVKLKDSTGRYIWHEEVRGSTPPMMFGKPYILNDDMPDIGAGNASVLFGDFSKYKIRMVKDFKVIRLNELLAEYLSVGIFGFARADGILLDAGTNPVKKLVHPSA
jgi:HK97 family phage major capsid protein